MKIVEIKECREKLQKLGRVYEGAKQELFIDWTCSGLRFHFQGTCLLAELGALPSDEYENPFDKASPSRKTWPYAAVFLDDQEEPISYFEVKDSQKNYLLYSSETEEAHTITIRKMSENQKGKLSINKFITDGVIERAKDMKSKLKIEFIGDSITCGFGNLSNDRNRLFYSADENGWMSHAAVAARRLEAEFNIISCSGIAASKGIGNISWGLPSMPELYPYTDRMLEEQQGKSTYTEWDFTGNKQDIIVLNLGTNDISLIEFNGDIAAGIQRFEEDYAQFLKLLREKNGAEPWIICALGSMDYYLYDTIEKVVQRFMGENGDHRISCFKYGRIRMTEGFGACAHPSLATHLRMGEELAAYIEALQYK